MRQLDGNGHDLIAQHDVQTHFNRNLSVVMVHVPSEDKYVVWMWNEANQGYHFGGYHHYNTGKDQCEAHRDAIDDFNERVRRYENIPGADVIEPWKDNLMQFARLLEEIRSNIDLGDDGYSLLSDSMDLEQTEVDELFDRAMVEFQRTKNSGRALRETPDKDIKAYHSGGQIASIR